MFLANFVTEPDISSLKNWIKDVLLPNIPSDSLIIMNSETYTQNRQDLPNEYSSKSLLIRFLKEKNLKYNASQTCSDLYNIIEEYAKNLPSKWKEIDSIYEHYGHKVVRLPGYMSHFNPIELAWSDVKRSFKERHKLEKVNPKIVHELTRQCFEISNLQGYVNRVLQIENYFRDREHSMLHYYKHFSNSSNTCNNELISHSVARNLTTDNLQPLHYNNMIIHSNMHLNLTNQNNVYPIDFRLIHQDDDGCYRKNIATSVLDTEESMENDPSQPGPSYLSL